jgi:hypothetical protein
MNIADVSTASSNVFYQQQLSHRAMQLPRRALKLSHLALQLFRDLCFTYGPRKV